MKDFNNLTKKFRYVNALGEEIAFTYNNGYLINKPVGIDTVAVSLSRAHGINQVGDTVQAENIQPRPINISGMVVGNGEKDRLLEVIRPGIKGKLYADDYYLNVNVVATPAVAPDETFAKFTFSLLAPYPYWQKANQARNMLAGMQYYFRFPCNFSQPYRFGKMIDSQFVTIVNDGQLEVPFKVVFLAKGGTATNPKVTNAVTGEYLLINKSMTIGETITVEFTHGRTNVTSSVDGDIRGALTLDSKLNKLNIGENVLKPEAEIGKENLEISIFYALEKVGVTV